MQRKLNLNAAVMDLIISALGCTGLWLDIAHDHRWPLIGWRGLSVVYSLAIISSSYRSSRSAHLCISSGSETLSSAFIAFLEHTQQSRLHRTDRPSLLYFVLCSIQSCTHPKTQNSVVIDDQPAVYDLDSNVTANHIAVLTRVDK